MRIPKILLRLQHTRLWKHKWPILTFSVFLLAAIPAAYISIQKTRVKKEREAINQRAIANYQAFRQSWEAKGEISDIHTFFAPQVPTEKDFYSLPAFDAEVQETTSPPFSAVSHNQLKGMNCDERAFYSLKGKSKPTLPYSTDIRLWLDPPQPLISEKESANRCLELLADYTDRLNAISEASKMPDSNNSMYREANNKSISYYATCLLARRSILSMAIGNRDSAFQDILTMLRLASHAQKYHTFIGLTKTIMLHINIERVIWEGLNRKVFDDHMLSELDKQLAQVDLNKQTLDAMRCEVVVIFENIELMKHTPEWMEPPYMSFEKLNLKNPNSWEDFFDKPKKTGGSWIEYHLIQAKAMTDIALYPNGKKALTITTAQFNQMRNWQEKCPLSKYLIKFPNQMYVRPSVIRQSGINSMRTAIALERHRLEHHQYPASLTSLIPNYLDSIPIDLITGSPVHYQLKDDGTPKIRYTGIESRKSGDAEIAIDWMYTP